MLEDFKPQERLSSLFKKISGTLPDSIEKMASSGSYRQYFRMKVGNHSIIGAYNEERAENKAFIEFSKHFASKQLPVPEILAEDLDKDVYLLQDLGDITLLNYLQSSDFPNIVTSQVKDIFKEIIKILPRFQIQGKEGLNFDLCYPRHAFDKQSMMWDLNYFKYYFLKLAKVPFNEQNLENDFNTLINFLNEADCNYFLYRDFQSRNIMLFNDQPYFIDYQGGRKGALQYDIASLLFEAKTRIPGDIREELLEFYLKELSANIKIPPSGFLLHYYGYVYIRLMQAMGAYGFRGLYERKELFLASIPQSLVNLEWLLANAPLPLKIPELNKVWKYLTESEYIRQVAKRHLLLNVSINSFSYKRGIPSDESVNGGGFVFDCRSIHNPGRYDRYKHLNGKDPEVQIFLDKEPEMEQFITHVIALVNQSIEKYIDKGFTNLMISFGCTGGQHRSVYSAERLYKYLVQSKWNNEMVIRLRHRELEMVK